MLLGDELTSGLDSFSAFSLMGVLSSLANDGNTGFFSFLFFSFLFFPILFSSFLFYSFPSFPFPFSFLSLPFSPPSLLSPVVMNIHQPSSTLYSMFDNLILLADGRIIYAGPLSEVADHFASLGFVCPQGM